MSHEDLSDHPFAVFMAGESYESPSERAWLEWCKQAEKLAGYNLDGNEDRDGYSLDGAYGAWEAGETPAEYVASIVVPVRPAEDLTPEGIQLVIPGAERRPLPTTKQGELF